MHETICSALFLAVPVQSDVCKQLTKNLEDVCLCTVMWEVHKRCKMFAFMICKYFAVNYPMIERSAWIWSSDCIIERPHMKRGMNNVPPLQMLHTRHRRQLVIHSMDVA